jgi:predicted SAM-dependent methyltransferase
MKLHLACGSNYIPEWINIDVDAPSLDLRHDLRQPMPFVENSVSHIYSEHFIEHVSKADAVTLLRHCLHVLRPGGRIRLSTPDLRYLAECYLAGDIALWQDVGWSPPSGADFMNEAMRSWGHQYLYDKEGLQDLLLQSGFSDLQWVNWRESADDNLRNLECRPYHHELIVEAGKA